MFNSILRVVFWGLVLTTSMLASGCAATPGSETHNFVNATNAPTPAQRALYTDAWGNYHPEWESLPGR